MIAAKIAQATRAVIEGFVIFSITVIKTLDPFGMTRPRFFAKTPKKTGMIQRTIVPIPAKKEAFETIFPELPEKHL